MYAIRSYYVPGTQDIARIVQESAGAVGSRSAGMQNSGVSQAPDALDVDAGLGQDFAGIVQNTASPQGEGASDADSPFIREVPSGRDGQRPKGNHLSVITSYSIHYTKLYEPAIKPNDNESEKNIMLIIEDNLDLSTVLVNRFSDLFEVHVAENGEKRNNFV